MSDTDKKKKIIESPKKLQDIINLFSKEHENTNKISSPIIDIKTDFQINDQFSSPLPKKYLIHENQNFNKSYDKSVNIKNDNNIYSPYVKRIDISGKKAEIIKENPSQKLNYTSYKKIPKKFYTPSPNLIKSEKLSDRFIPLNKGINLMEKFNLTTKFQELNENNNNYEEINKEELDNNNLYNEMLKTNFLNEYNSSSLMNKLNLSKANSNKELSGHYSKIKLFSWKKDKNKKNENFINNILSAQKENENILNNNNFDINLNQRKISLKPYKELPAPNLIDDFYLNLLDWSQKNQIAVGCSSSVILWNNNKTLSETLFTYDNTEDENNSENNENKYVSSLIWSEDGERLAVGNSYGQVEIYDINKKELISIFKGHSSRVGVVSWNRNLISSGSKDYSIITRDTRCKDTEENIIKRFLGHQQEVCGLKWSFDGSQLASGGNDNNLMVWSLHSNKPLMYNNDHAAAVKAIAWSPHHHNILASGGGTADRTIRFWNTTTYEPIFKVDTGSQVCNLVFSKSSNELVSTHGYSLNQINVWKLPNMQKIKTLTGHSYRVLYLSLSPDGQSIVTGAGDKTLKFWNIFPPFKNNYNSRLFPSNKDFH